MRRLRDLSRPQGRYQSSALLLEGSHLLNEALNAGLMPFEIVATPKWIESNPEVVKRFSSEVKINLVTELVLKASLTTVNPNGVAALLSLNMLPKPKKHVSFVLALDRLQDPGNLGTLFRTALAAGIEEIWLAFGADPLSQKVLRASTGAVFHLPFRRLGHSEEDAVIELSKSLLGAQAKGSQVIGTYSPCSSSYSRDVVPYWELDWTKPTVLVLGNEGSGVHLKVEACCTHAVTLPHNEMVQSLNVASAAVPLLLERLRSKMTS